MGWCARPTSVFCFVLFIFLLPSMSFYFLLFFLLCRYDGNFWCLPAANRTKQEEIEEKIEETRTRGVGGYRHTG
jgi:hypothetical protein